MMRRNLHCFKQARLVLFNKLADPSLHWHICPLDPFATHLPSPHHTYEQAMKKFLRLFGIHFRKYF